MYLKLIDCKTSNTLFEFKRDDEKGKPIINLKAKTHEFVKPEMIDSFEVALTKELDLMYKLGCELKYGFIHGKGEEAKEKAKALHSKGLKTFRLFVNHKDELMNTYNFQSKRIEGMIDGYLTLLVMVQFFSEGNVDHLLRLRAKSSPVMGKIPLVH